MNSSKFNLMMNFLNKNVNPMSMIRQKIMSNPQFQESFARLKNMQQSSGLTEEQFVYQLYKQNGINPEQVKQLSLKMGF